MNLFHSRTGFTTWLGPAVITAATAAVMATGALAPAWAGQPHHAATAPALTRTVRLPAGTTVAHLRIGSLQAVVMKPNQVITCTLAVQYPHKSSHVPGTVNVVGTIICSAPVSELSIRVGLYLNNVLVAQGANTNFGSASIQGNAARGCVSGSYRGGDTGLVIFPPGYEPPSSNFGGQEVFSPAIGITC